jgi:hypothetical protein
VQLHVKLRAFGEDIWTIDGPPVRFGFLMPTRMIVVRLSDGALWVNSPVALPDDALEEVKALGPVRYLVAPTPLHVWRLARWRQLFPTAEVWGLRDNRRRGHASDFSGFLLDRAPPAWSQDLDQMIFRGNAAVEEVEFFHKRSRSLIMADFVQIYSVRNRTLPVRGLLWLAGVLGGGVRVDIRLSFANRALGRASLARLLSWDFEKLIVAHGECRERDAKPFVERAFQFLSAR